MTSALVHLNGSNSAHPLVSDLEAAGIRVLGVAEDRSKLVQEVVRHAPDVVICDDSLPGETLFRVTQAIADTAPCPVLVFTSDGDADNIVRATESGIHAYVVSGYGPHRLRPLIHLAQARFRRERALQEELRDISSRFEERKMVDRAKGILMRARQVSDDDAFQMLRTASMHSNQRLGQVSQHIIHSAHFAEAVNRSGQLRMLSQRLVKLHLLQQAGVQAARCGEQLKESVRRIDANLAHLGRSLSRPTHGDLLGQVVLAWTDLKQVLNGHPKAGQRAPGHESVDELAELLLQAAERLTSNLENSGSVMPLQLLNVAGRQRMLSQRFAKYALLAVLGDSSLMQRSEDGMAESSAAFEQALSYLNGIPLTSQDIRNALDTASMGWQQMLADARDARQSSGQERLTRLERLAVASEDLLNVFERLSDHYERSMQMLVG
ncbi:type IV pili methyl-accepting chemotaxis transducer N-terminal domain-containing protein [Polaromonas jejuensis]|uniref:Type IV pili methyl-accepting chemotaxis transducer N-terminal domain-containing protein n=1 Tax=Polaromonas jejuensis TaxID=457502 RepID=A0ABW0Q3M3_9BURK|nr:type IV pili methyl-accepting chemotaxis transducer N-terminal domain-containing protein [Polaromonas jejuensis]